MVKIDRSSKNPNLISIFTGNICNLACTLCDPVASSRWQYELGLTNVAKSNNEFSVDTVDFTDAISITFGGGEPFLNKSTLLLLKKINSDTTIIMHLNGTVLPSQDLLNECARFKDISFVFSIDDVGDRFNFLRYPANWNRVTENMFWLKDNCPGNITFSVNTVISLLNEATYTDVNKWITKNFPSNKSGKLVECFTNESNGLLNRLNYAGQEKSYVEFLDKLDKKRNTDWRATFPEATKILLNFKPT